MFRTFALLFSMLTLTSCISYHSDGNDKYNRPVGLEVGVTTETWVAKNLGKPYSKHTTRRGTSILHYTYDSNEETKVSLLLVINFHEKDRGTSHLYIELEDGIVTDFWDD